MSYSVNDFQDWVLKETTHWMAIDKPAGLIVEKSPYESPTIEDLALDYLSGQYKNPFLGIVHRLDRVTSGVLLLAKKRSALRHLNEQFRLGQIQKTYHSYVEKAPPQNTGTLEHWLVKDQKHKKAIISEKQKANSQKVILQYKVLKETEIGFLLEIRPQTGKFHQIRAQLGFIGCPIVGDEKYNLNPMASFTKKIELYASQLNFCDPINEKNLSIRSKDDYNAIS